MTFERRYSLEIGKPLVRSLSAPLAPLGEETIFKEELQLDSTSLTVTDHQITFKCDRSAGKQLNAMSVTIYNLSDDSYGYILANRGESVFARLLAGYGDDLRQIFIGNVASVTDKFEGVDRKTTLYIMDGEVNSKESYSNLGFLPGTSYAHIIRVYLRDLGLPEGIMITPEGGPASPHMYSGKTIEGLRILADNTNSFFSIQNMRVNFVPLSSTNLLPFSTFDPVNSPLIGSPTALGDSAGTLKATPNGTKRGMKFKVLLDASLSPDTLINMKSRDFDGVFRIQKVKHVGDYRGQQWYTECETTEVVDTPVINSFTVSSL